MLNPVLRKELLPEHRVVYDLKIPLSDEGLRERITNTVRHIRKQNRRTGVNKLEAKLDKFGNNGGWYRERVKQLVKRLYQYKTISKNSIGRWRSIEFELIFKSKESCEEFGYAIRNAGLANYVTIQEDRSLRRNDYDKHGVPYEVVLSYEIGNEDAVRLFCKCLKGRAYVNYSCGTHFHIDMRQYDQEKVTEFGNRLAQAVPALKLLLPVDRRDNKFCQKTINSVSTPCVGPHKYAFINLAAYSKHKTIEIRGHSGTINAEKILNWIKLCEHIMLSPFNNTSVQTVEDLIKTYKLDRDLIAYVKERYLKFSDSSGDAGYYSTYKNKTEEEETPASQVEVPVHPAFLNPIPKAKVAQPAPQVIITNNVIINT